MKNTFLLLVLLIGLAGTACNKSADKQVQQVEATTETAADSQQLAYICPMRCEGSASQEPGKCPVCGMDLEKNAGQQPITSDSTAHPAH